PKLSRRDCDEFRGALQSMPRVADSVMNDLMAQVVAASGLSSIFAERSIARALRRAGFDPDALSRPDLKRALPEIGKMLATFMDAAAAVQHLSRIRRLAE